MSNIPESIKLDDGRTLSLREIDPADMLDLIEAAGSAMTSVSAGAWLGYAQSIATVCAIDGVPVQMPISKHEIKELARRIGSSGVVAVQRALYPDKAVTSEGELSADAATAKN